MNDLQPLFPDLCALPRPLLIAGPCSAETEAQTLETARQLAAEGTLIFRAGLWKPRTKPGGFEGVGVEGLTWLQRVKEETGMRTATEVATSEHVEAALGAGIDLLWIGARTSANPFAVQEIAEALRGADIPVLVKNPLSPELELWIGALERLYNAGLRRLGAIHRGFGSLDHTHYRNQPQWSIPIELRRRIPALPLLCDPSHIGGRRELIGPLCRQALSMGFDGLFIESHCSPDAAWSDPAQQITPAELSALRHTLTIRERTAEGEELALLRAEIDKADDDLLTLLAQRMEISRRIGTYKRQQGIPVLQRQRYDQLLARRTAQAAEMGLNAEFIRTVLQTIHEESVRQQVELNEETGSRH